MQTIHSSQEIYLLNKTKQNKKTCLHIETLVSIYLWKVDGNEQSSGNGVHNYNMSYLFDLGQIPLTFLTLVTS